MNRKDKPIGEARPLNFSTLPVADVPVGRKGKHHAIVAAVLSDLQRIAPGTALRIPLSELNESKAKVRSALSRATQKLDFRVVTSSNGDELFIWRLEQ